MITIECRRIFVDTVYFIYSTIMQILWTAVYLFYFLFKGKPEWKCERLPYTPKNCCVETKTTQSSITKPIEMSDSLRTGLPRIYQGKTLTQRFMETSRNFTSNAEVYGRRIGRFCKKVIVKILEILRTIVLYLWAFLKALLYTNVPSKTLPVTPKPFQVKQNDNLSFNKVEFNPQSATTISTNEMDDVSYSNECAQRAVEHYSSDEHIPIPSERHRTYEKDDNEQRVMTNITTQETHSRDNPSWQDNLTYTSHENPRFTDTSLDSIQNLKRMDSNHYGSEVDHQNNDGTQKKKEPVGIGKLPADVMAELHGTQKMRQEKEASIQREMTQSCHPDMAQWKTIENDSRYDRSASATPFRASSVGPTMRRLEQVVSRLDDTSDNESQYVFRTKPSQYALRNQMYSSAEATEKMRDSINRIPTYESSRPITPAQSVVSGRFTPSGYETYAPSSYRSEESSVRRRARTVDPFSRENLPYSTSSFYATSPVTSHTVRRTPAAFDRGANFAHDRDGVIQGSVKGFVNQWPPASNATGAEVIKDELVREMLKEDDDELVTTMCRRIVERKTEDKWRWLDERGHLLDEKSQKTWKGELDTVLREGPGEGKHWKRTVECLPTGNTRFQDVSRQYGNNYVVESIVRNY